jgi:hypothetical protein
MEVTLWCRVHVMGPDRAALASHRLEGAGLPDLGAVDDVARLALLAGRIGGSIILSDVTPALRSLLDLSGLRIETEWEAEGREETLGVHGGQEKLHPGDLPS